MAADVTLVAIPDSAWATPVGWLTTRQVIDFVSAKELFDDEEMIYDDDGEPLYMIPKGWPDTPQWECKRDRFMDWYWDQFGEHFDSFEVGPWSPLKQGLGLSHLYSGRNFLPGPTRAMFNAFAEGVRLNRGHVSKAGNLMSFPMGNTWYRGKNWKPSPGKRRRGVQRWLRSHVGDWVFAQSW